MQVVLRANDANLSLALSSSVNYKIVKGLYAGLGLEPTWYVASDGKKFDIPLLWKVGYNINNKIDISVNYRLGFTNTIDTERSSGRDKFPIVIYLYLSVYTL